MKSFASQSSGSVPIVSHIVSLHTRAMGCSTFEHRAATHPQFRASVIKAVCAISIHIFHYNTTDQLLVGVFFATAAAAPAAAAAPIDIFHCV